MKIIRLFAVALICLLVASCGGSGDASKVADKIKAGESLTQTDYSVMIDYCGKYAEKAQKIQDEINSLPSGSDETYKLEEKMADLSESYPYMNSFMGKISSCTQEEIGSANVAMINTYAPLMWFTAPSWAVSGADGDVVGFIEDMPDSDSAGVISTGEGVEVDSVR